MLNQTNRKRAIVAMVLFAIFDLINWLKIWQSSAVLPAEIKFLDVGQGDASLIRLTGGQSILIDGGPNSGITGQLDWAMGQSIKYIDLVAVSHPQRDHFAGILAVLESYRVGAFLYSGREPTENDLEWQELKNKLEAGSVPKIVLGGGDFIKIGDSRLEIFSPGPELWQSGELNDTSLVMRLVTPSARALFVGDAGDASEKFLAGLGDISAEILKVGHHGSKYSSSPDFLALVKPLVSIISVGAQNNYGHPSPLTLDRLRNQSSAVFRTDSNGTVNINLGEGKLRVFTEK